MEGDTVIKTRYRTAVLTQFSFISGMVSDVNGAFSRRISNHRRQESVRAVRVPAVCSASGVSFSDVSSVVMRLVQRCRSFWLKADACILCAGLLSCVRHRVRSFRQSFRPPSFGIRTRRLFLSFTSSNRSFQLHCFLQIYGCAANLQTVRACREYRCNA